MADDLFGRRAKVTIQLPAGSSFIDVQGANVVEISGGIIDPANPNNLGMRIQFDITKTDQKEPNTSQIIITNLSDTRRASLKVKGVKFSLDAGYVATGMTRIIRGDARTIDHVRDGADWNTTARLGDGERAYRFARVNESFSPGTGAGSVLRFLANRSGIQIGNSSTVASALTTTFDQGYVVNGSWQQAMDKLLRAVGYVWSIQDETIQILKPNEAVDAQIPLISPETGLIGSPEMGTPEKKGKPQLVEFESLLVATRPGAKVHLRSKRYDADVRVKRCRFYGDTHGGPWFSKIQGVILGQ